MEWYLLALISALSLGFADLFMKKSLFKVHSMQFLGTVTFTMAVVLLFFIPMMDFSFSSSLIFLILLKSALVCVSWLLWVKGAHHLEISQSTPLKNIESLYVFFLAFLLVGERLTALQIAGVFTLVLGASFIELEHNVFHFWKGLQNLPRKYLAYIFIAFFLGACAALIDRVVIPQVGVLTYFFLVQTLIAIVYFIILSVKYGGYQDIIYTYRKEGIWVIGFVFCMLVTDITYFSAVAMPAALVSLIVPIKRLSSLFSTILGGRLFHEQHVMIRSLSCLIMILGVLLLVW